MNIRSLDDVAQRIAEGNSIAVLGAGMSVPVVPAAGDLARYLLTRLVGDCRNMDVKMAAEELLGGGTCSLTDAGACYEIAYGANGRAQLIKTLKEHIHKRAEKMTCPSHAILARMPIRCFIDYNYDCLFETAVRVADLSCEVVMRDTQVQDLWQAINDKRCCIVKPHGDIDKSELDEFVVTEMDYARLAHHKPALLDEIRSLMRRHTTLFLGYGLAEPDFRQQWFDFQHRTQGMVNRSYVISLGSAGRQVFEPIFYDSVNITMIRAGLDESLEQLGMMVAKKLLEQR